MIRIKPRHPGRRYCPLAQADPVEGLEESMVSNVGDAVFEIAKTLRWVCLNQRLDQIAALFRQF